MTFPYIVSINNTLTVVLQTLLYNICNHMYFIRYSNDTKHMNHITVIVLIKKGREHTFIKHLG